jgi:hypothetical protein
MLPLLFRVRCSTKMDGLFLNYGFWTNWIMMCFIYIFHLLTQITPQIEQCFNNEMNKQFGKKSGSFRIFEVKKWDLRNWIETGNEGIFRMRICRDDYKVHRDSIQLKIDLFHVTRCSCCLFFIFKSFPSCIATKLLHLVGSAL